MSAAMLQAPVASCRSSFAGAALRPRAPARQPLALRRAARADSEVKPAPKEKEGKKEAWKVPTLDPNTPSPIFGGSTGGLLSKAQVSGLCRGKHWGRMQATRGGPGLSCGEGRCRRRSSM